MTIEELKDKHKSESIDEIYYKETYPANHTNLSIEYTISVLGEVNTNILNIGKSAFEYFVIHDIIRDKIQELKQYLEK